MFGRSHIAYHVGRYATSATNGSARTTRDANINVHAAVYPTPNKSTLMRQCLSTPHL